MRKSRRKRITPPTRREIDLAESTDSDRAAAASVTSNATLPSGKFASPAPPSSANASANPSPCECLSRESAGPSPPTTPAYPWPDGGVGMHLRSIGSGPSYIGCALVGVAPEIAPNDRGDSTSEVACVRLRQAVRGAQSPPPRSAARNIWLRRMNAAGLAAEFSASDSDRHSSIGRRRAARARTRPSAAKKGRKSAGVISRGLGLPDYARRVRRAVRSGPSIARAVTAPAAATVKQRTASLGTRVARFVERRICAKGIEPTPRERAVEAARVTGGVITPDRVAHQES